MLPYHVRVTGIKSQLSEAESVFLLLMLEPFFLSSENDAKNRFFFLQKNKLSGYIGLMVQMLNLNFVAAAVSNY